MISLEKLKNLPLQTAIKKIYLNLLGHQQGRFTLTAQQQDEYFDLLVSSGELDTELLIKLIDRYKSGERLQLITDYLAQYSSLGDVDWDWLRGDGAQDASKRVVKDRYLVLDELRSPYNIGAIFRSAESFGIKKIFLLGKCASPLHPKSIRTSCGTVDSVEFEEIGFERFFNILNTEFKDHVLFALECGGCDIRTYDFPQKGICVIGNEEFGVSRQLLEHCSTKVSITTFGSKGSLNVSVATGILLHSWFF